MKHLALKTKNGIIIFALVTFIFIMFFILFSQKDRIWAIRLNQAIVKHDVDKIEQIIEKNPKSINTYPTLIPRTLRGIADDIVQYPLATAAKEGDLDTVQLLLNHGANINAQDDILSDTALLCALNSDETNRFQIANLLVNNGADVTIRRKNNDNYDAVRCCVMSMVRNNQNQSAEGLETLMLICEATPKEYDFGKALCESMILGVDSSVNYLLEMPIFNIDEIKLRGYTLLTCACKYNYDSVVKKLIEENCSVDTKDMYGKNALAYAEENQNDQIISILRG